jgi:hypothetical protein
MVTNSAFSRRLLEVRGITALSLDRNTIQPMRTRFVRPGRGVLVYSHDRIAKKNPPRTISAAWAWAGDAPESKV